MELSASAIGLSQDVKQDWLPALGDCDGKKENNNKDQGEAQPHKESALHEKHSDGTQSS
jgi:hypothetical protein